MKLINNGEFLAKVRRTVGALFQELQFDNLISDEKFSNDEDRVYSATLMEHLQEIVHLTVAREDFLEENERNQEIEMALRDSIEDNEEDTTIPKVIPREPRAKPEHLDDLDSEEDISDSELFGNDLDGHDISEDEVKVDNDDDEDWVGLVRQPKQPKRREAKVRVLTTKPESI